MRLSNYTAVEDVLDINADRYWYYIPGFNGYEISNDGIIRSMKHYKAYPFGIIIKPKTNRKGEVIHPYDPSYELSNNKNQRVTVLRSQLAYLAETNPYKVTGYPRRTCVTDRGSRNPRCAIIEGRINTNITFPDNKVRRSPHFTIISDNQLTDQKYDPEYTYNDYEGIKVTGYSKIICPVENIIGGGESFWRRKL